ncbi:MAG: PDZ domain-containing protein, partial [Candidatus Parcubacteria bacterium]|nr:PDZ domain-containing protein [Candidatus Parcubacteria bacterium]
AQAQGAENIGFALTINIAKRDINDAIDFGKIKYPYLGIRYKVVDNGLQLVKGPNQEPAVESTGPAGKAGLKENDIILEFGGVKIDQQNTLAHLLSQHRVGDKIDLKVLRDGKEMTVTVVLEERPENI